VEPELVAGLEVGYVGDGEGLAGAGDLDLNFGAFEVEASRLGVRGGRQGDAGKEQSNAEGGKPAGEELLHHTILDG
jgi:hypothetical protein